MSQFIAVFGATSLIAQESCRALLTQGSASFLLVGRDSDKLAILANDLRSRGAESAETLVGELSQSEFQDDLIARIKKYQRPLDIALFAWGSLPDQVECEIQPEIAMTMIDVNFNSQARLLLLVANLMESKKNGSIVAISSVAGDRGRQSNYVYGAAKAGLTAFLQGLRQRMAKHGVHVLTVRPGFVKTPMTHAVPKNFLFAEAADVGRVIARAIKRKSNDIYVPWFWYWIMLVIRNIPEFLFKRLRL